MNSMRRWMVTAAAALVTTGTVSAEERLVVVELYTSQGCSACPPADRLLTRLTARDDVLPLALHVDYWDYIGWKDQFGNPAHTERQKAYAHAAGSRTIYTPQMVIGGVDHLVGNREMELGELIEAHGDLASVVALSVSRGSDTLTIEAQPLVADLPEAIIVQLVRYMPEQIVEIRRGENAGKTLTYSNIVTEWSEIARWSGNEPLLITAEAPGDEQAAVVLQQEGPGAILAAAVAR